MPPQVVKSTLFQKLGQRVVVAHEKHKADETTYGNAGLPAGIETGIAKLDKVYFGEFQQGDNKGEMYFIASGIVHLPKSHDGIPCEGLRTQIGPEPICDTPKSTGKRKTMEDHYAWVLNELRKLGVKTSDVAPQNIEAVCAALTKTKPFFRFRTWKGQKQTTGQYAGREPRVNHDWEGIVQYDPNNPPGGDDMQDGSTVVDTPTVKAGGKTSRNGSTPPKRTEPAPTSVPTTSADSYDEAEELDTLAAYANDGDEDAIAKLEEMAREAGITDEQLADESNDWTAIVALMREGGSEGSEESEEGQEEVPPDIGLHVRFKPKDPRTKKPGTKVVDCTVESVNVDNRTVVLVNRDKPTIKYGRSGDVSWDELISLDE